MTIEIFNKTKTEKAVINSTMLVDGLNYYVTVFTFNEIHKKWFWNEYKTQWKTIKNKRSAVQFGRQLLSN